MAEFFRRLAHRVTLAVGSWQFFLVSVALLLVWAATGPVFDFSDAWQLVVNTSTTILTYLLGILILLEANRQARDPRSSMTSCSRAPAVRGIPWSTSTR